MDVLAYNHIAIGWSFARDHELSTGRGKTLQRSAVRAAVNFEVLLVSSLLSWFCVSHLHFVPQWVVWEERVMRSLG